MGQNQEQKEIISKIIEAASHINKVTRSGTGDHIIVSSEILGSDLFNQITKK
jgi:hypothetical protein